MSDLEPLLEARSFMEKMFDNLQRNDGNYYLLDAKDYREACEEYEKIFAAFKEKYNLIP